MPEPPYQQTEPQHYHASDRRVLDDDTAQSGERDTGPGPGQIGPYSGETGLAVTGVAVTGLAVIGVAGIGLAVTGVAGGRDYGRPPAARTTAAASRPMAAIAAASSRGKRDLLIGSPSRIARWLAIHSR